MQEINLIPLSTPNYPPTSNLAMISTPAPGLQNSRYIACKVDAPQAGNTLNIPRKVADKKNASLVENQVQFQNREGDKIGKSGKFMRIFSSYALLIGNTTIIKWK